MKVDFIRWGLLLIPPMMRRPIQAHIIRCCMREINKVYDDFVRWEVEINSRLSKNGQLCVLRRLLNEMFFPNESKIRIEEPEPLTVLAYPREANKSIIINNRVENVFIIPRRGDSCIAEFDFRIIVPSDTSDTIIEQIIAIVNNYKLAGKRFIVSKE